MKRLLLIAITTISLLGLNGFGIQKLQAQSLEKDIQGVQISKAYPNPAKNFIHFDYSIPRDKVNKAEIQFFNLIGEVVLKQELHTAQDKTIISITKLKQGVYFYRLVVNGTEKGNIQKLIVE